MNNLKLRAEDKEDIIILSAYLQDAVTKMAYIVYQSKRRRFIIMLNRYVWENDYGKTDDITREKKSCFRIRTGLHFDDVIGISSQNINPHLKDHPLELLSIEAHRTPSETFFLDFIFSGNGIIRLECEVISGHMLDIGDPWLAKCHPKHQILDALLDEGPENTG